MADFEGWLEKAGGITGTTNQKRYFVLKGAALYYYKDKPANDTAKEQGILELAGTTFGDFGMGSSWSISGGKLKKTYTLTAADQEERSTWIDKLTPAREEKALNEEKAPPAMTQKHEDFMDAASRGDLDVLNNLCVWFGDLNFKDKYGCTACHRAADSGKLQVLQWLHGKGADINAKDNYGETPCDKASGEVKQWLQDIGLHDITAKGNDGKPEAKVDAVSEKKMTPAAAVSAEMKASNPQTAVEWYNLGNKFVKSDISKVEIRGAEYTRPACYLEAIKLKPGLKEAWLNVGVFWTSANSDTIDVSGKSYNRCGFFAEAVRLDPNFGQAWVNLGTFIPNKTDTVEIAGSGTKVHSFTKVQAFAQALRCDDTKKAWWKALAGSMDEEEVVEVKGKSYSKAECATAAA